MTIILFIYYLIFALLFFFFGRAIASFLNVVIYRTAADCDLVKDGKGKVLKLAPFWQGRSLTDCCQQPIKAWHNIPLISFILLRGKCPYCHAKIAKKHFFTELIAGLYTLFFTFLIYGQVTNGQLLNPITASAQYLFFLILIFVLIADFQYLIIPDFFIILLSILAIILVGNYWSSGLIAIVASTVFFTLLYFGASWVFKKEALGLGDIKLMMPLSFVLGWPWVLMAIFLSFIVGGFFATLLLLFKQKKIGQILPFGPFLVLGFVLSYFWAEAIWAWYLALII
ncbi:MAG: prepilin peptidase [Candidatus Pacebacteria bacterium]|nr:prepilin peptidase [Candidatus Paceibacterota bacterium]